MPDNKSEQKVSLRRYDIDWLRNFGILLLFPFHAARIFDYWEPNYVKNMDLSWGLSWFISIAGYWFMPLLFWVAGTASFYALETRTGTQYVKERMSRLFIPLVFGVLIIVPPQGYLAKLSQSGDHLTYWQFLPRFFCDFSDLSGYFGTFTPAHLWFILYLLVISLGGLPLFLWLRKKPGRKAVARWAGILSNPWVYVLVFVPLTLTEALPAPGGKNLFFYFFLFVAGYITSTDERFTLLICRIRFKVLLFLIPYTPVWFVISHKYASEPDWSPASILIAFMRDLALWLTLAVVLGYGKKFLNFRHKWLPYLNRAAFPVYIVHQTVLLIIGFFVVSTNLGVLPKFILITVLALIVSLGLYEFVIRRTFLTRWLFGVKAELRLKESKVTVQI